MVTTAADYNLGCFGCKFFETCTKQKTDLLPCNDYIELYNLQKMRSKCLTCANIRINCFHCYSNKALENKPYNNYDYYSNDHGNYFSKLKYDFFNKPENNYNKNSCTVAEKNVDNLITCDRLLSHANSNAKKAEEEKEDNNMVVTKDAMTSDANSNSLETRKDVSLFTKLATDTRQCMVDGTWMTVAQQSIEMMRKPLVAYLSSQFDKSTAKRIGTFLNTPIGEAAFALMLGNGLNAVHASGVSSTLSSPKVARLSLELQKYGWHKGTNVLAEFLTGPVRNLVTALVESLPDVQVENDQNSDR